MSNRSQEVDQFMDKLDHPLKEEIEKVRTIILDANSQISEHIKWNAPSFCFEGDDRVTLKLYPRDCIQVVFHRGVKVRNGEEISFEDRTGLLEWVAGDRAMVTLLDMKDVEAKETALTELVDEWVKSTT